MNESQPGRWSRRDDMRAERLEVLHLLATGDISAQEADALLDALDTAGELVSGRGSGPSGGGRAPARTVRVRISDPATGKASINLALPVGLVDAALNVARRFSPENVPPVDAVRQSIAAGMSGSIIDIVNQNERIEVIVEPS